MSGAVAGRLGGDGAQTRKGAASPRRDRAQVREQPCGAEAPVVQGGPGCGGGPDAQGGRRDREGLWLARRCCGWPPRPAGDGAQSREGAASSRCDRAQAREETCGGRRPWSKAARVRVASTGVRAARYG